MFETIKKIFSKSSETKSNSIITLEELPSWLDEQEKDCITRRDTASTASREQLLILEKELHQTLTEFGEEALDDEPHHHKVEQVNRHALPQFCRKIEAELKGDFSEDGEVFYQEFAGLINGCFKAYKGPGRYLHHLYPDEVKAFKQTLDQMGQELNRMTDMIRISRERLTQISDLRDILHERDVMQDESGIAITTGKQFEEQLSELTTSLSKAESDLENVTSSEEYSKYLHLQEEAEQVNSQLEKAHESFESQLRVAVPVWKRAEKAFQEQAKQTDEKNMEILIHLASSPRRDEDELSKKVAASASALFGLLDSGSLQSKNSFEKSLFTTAEEYSKKFADISTALCSLSDEQTKKKQQLDQSTIHEKKLQIVHQVDEISKMIEELNQEETKRKEKLSSLKERDTSSLKTLKEKFSLFTDGKVNLLLPEKEL